MRYCINPLSSENNQIKKRTMTEKSAKKLNKTVMAETSPFLRGVFLHIKFTGLCKIYATITATMIGRTAPKTYLKNK